MIGYYEARKGTSKNAFEFPICWPPCARHGAYSSSFLGVVYFLVKFPWQNRILISSRKECYSKKQTLLPPGGINTQLHRTQKALRRIYSENKTKSKTETNSSLRKGWTKGLS